VRIILYLLTCFHFCFRKYSDFSLDTCNELDSPYTGPIKANKKPLLTSFSKFNRQSSRLSKKILSMENSDDDLIIPLKRVLRKKKVKTIVSSDSDETIIIDDDDEDEPPKPIKKKVVHRRKIMNLIKYIFTTLFI
jgi:hypothetical protein